MKKLSKAAEAVLEYHRARSDQACHARLLVGVSPLLPSSAELDAAYEELVAERLVELGSDVVVFTPKDGGPEEVKTLYRLKKA